jgi:hypothetical protein
MEPSKWGARLKGPTVVADTLKAGIRANFDGLKFGLPDVALGVTPAAALGPLPVVEDVSASFDEIGVGEPAASTAKKMVEATDAVHTSALGKSPAAVFIAALAEVLHEVL